MPVWIVAMDEGRVGFTTDASSWKVKRIRSNARVALQASNFKGDVEAGSEEVTGTAEVVGQEGRSAVEEKLKKKYRLAWWPVTFSYWVKEKLGKRAPDEGAAVFISLD